MLTRLIIRNLAIIKEVEITFKLGLNVVSGETGAGKTMLVDALVLLSGGRASTEMIREGEDTCEVQGIFDPARVPVEVRNDLSEHDIYIEDDLNIRRIVQRNGKSRAYINGVIVTQGYLALIGTKLLSVLSQREHQRLFSPLFQLELLDRFLKHDESLNVLRSIFQDWRSLEKRYGEMKNSQNEYLKRADYLKYQLNEIKEYDFKEGEEEKLRDMVSRADNASMILKNIFSTLDMISYCDDSLICRLNKLIPEFTRYQDVDEGFKKLSDLLNDAIVKLEDMICECSRISKSYEFDEAELESNRERLSEIKRLKKKFMCEDLQGILKCSYEMSLELENLESMEEKLCSLEKELGVLKTRYRDKAVELSESRKGRSVKLSKKIEAILEDLGLFRGGFYVNFTESNPSPTGIDRVDYLISTNPGEPMKPISRIASGGEMSRLMLAVQSATNEVYGYGIQVFDEVDAGIGGNVGFKVGGLLKRISNNHQVVVITHLPQIAVFSDHHLWVWKEEGEGRTHVRVEELSAERRFNEITRMLGMENHTEALDNVKHMIEKAKNLLQSDAL